MKRPDTRRRGPRKSGARKGSANAGKASANAGKASASVDGLTIERMGAEGDGLARSGAGESVAVPFSLPGERVEASVAGRTGTLLSVAERSPERREPVCVHHGRPGEEPACGACALQHWEPAAYETWKRGLLVAALERSGVEAAVDPLVPCPPASRRRLVLSARRTEGGVLIGFNAARSERVVDMRECPVAAPAIVSALPHLRIMLGRMLPPGGRARVSVLAAENGLDVRVDADGELAPVPPPPAVTRLSLGDETVHEREAPRLTFGDVPVTPPPGAFVQAVEAAERAMADLVTGHLAGCRSVADLFAGSGTFALRLARFASVHAVEGEAAPLAALDRAWRNGSRLRAVTTERRDLYRRPLPTTELTGRDRPRGGRGGGRGGAARFDGLVLDPPRAGAERQVREIAGSGIPRIAAVSCNPLTLARDLRILVDGGYRVDRVVPVDQFAFTAHLEAVALLTLG